jgi:Zn-dependent metalloprotease
MQMRRNLPKLILTAFLLIAVSFSTIAQKEKNPIENFKSPFKAKKGTTITPKEKTAATLSNKKSNSSELFIARTKGSFSINTEKYNLSKENIENNFRNYFLVNSNNDFKKNKVKNDELGFTHISYQHFYKGIPIEGSTVFVHLKNGKANSINGKVIEIPEMDVTEQIDSLKALQIAKNHLKVTEIFNKYPIELVLLPLNDDGNYKLVYKIRIDAMKPLIMYNIYIDAVTGNVVGKVNLITDVDTPATANTLYSGSQTITTDSYNGSYRLRETTRKIETYDATTATDLTVSGGFVGSVDYTNNSTTWGPSPLLTSFTISTVSQNWWYTSIIDESPDLYIKVKNGLNQVVYDGRNNYINNTFPPVTMPLYIYLNNPPYTVEVWDYDPVGGDDLGGTYSISTNSGTQTWSGNGNNGQYVILGTSNNPALDVHWGMEKSYDFYKNILNRNSFDGLGSTIKNYINPPTLQTQIGFSPNNASAVPPPYNIMQYGLGDGQLFKPLVGLDVEGHEFTHLVVANNGNGGLKYQAESGALNESFADIFGTCIEFYARPSTANWTIGEDIIIPAPQYLRSISNPNSGLQPQPDTYKGSYWINTADTTNDHGGVHTNSGVQNFWFYLLCQGGSGTNDLGKSYNVTGIGISQARQLAYRNLVTYLGANATYLDAYNGSLLAAQDLYGNPSAQYTAVRQAWYAVGIGNDPNNFCSGTTNLTATSGSFTDGSGSSNYNNNQNCKWVIAPVGANQITLNFTSFATEANYDTVFVYNGPNESYPVLMTWWGNALPPTVSTSAGTGAICIKFKTDNTVTAAGWAANYTSTGITPSCDGGNVLAAPTGTFTDGSGTSNYGNNQLCYWLIAPPCATSVTLSLTQLNTEAGYDGLIVYNGSSTSSPVLGSFSGTTLPSSVTASSGQMLVVFTSDFSTNAQGFSANYTSTGSAYCSGTTTLNTADYGTITDGSGASNYCNNQNCSWLIQPPQATSVTLNFSAFDVEAASTDGNSIYDAVEIYNGTTTAAPLLGRFSGNTIPPAITASSGSMLVRFFSDVSVTKAGWSANYTSTSPAYCNSATTLTAANGTFTDGSGTSQYANNSNCSWLIQPTNAGNITLSFTEFNTELNYDGVIVYNGANASAPVLGQFSGTTIPSPVIATGGRMFVTFLSDEALRSGGWTANYTSTTLPLNLLEFKVNYLGTEVSLKWITTSEVNTKDFIVARSKDGNTWTDLGSVTALNTSGTNNYSFNDLQPIQGINYYRLKMVDKDGKFTYSPIRTINITKNNLPFVIAPNPASTFATIYFNQLIKAAEISVIDVQGRKLFTDIIKNAGIATYHLKTENFVSGVYIIHVQTNSGNFTERLFINK